MEYNNKKECYTHATVCRSMTCFCGQLINDHSLNFLSFFALFLALLTTVSMWLKMAKLVREIC